ncbi:MAG: PAS domain-containing protein [Anaerolineae bacterium]|nr:PAS domain-containing protein [Anaerolineae bacterium]
MSPWGWLLVIAAIVVAALHYTLSRRATATVQELQRELARLTQAEERLRSERDVALARMEALGAAVNEGLILLDSARRIVWWNAAAESFFSVPPGTVRGRALIEGLRDYDLHQVVVETLASAHPVTRQTSLGERIVRGRALVVGSLPNQGVVLALQDVTELQRLGRARRDLVANVSHDLRTPLTAIRLMVDTLRDGALHERKMAKRLLEQIATQVDGLAQLSQELLDLSQIESGKALFKLVPTLVVALVTPAVSGAAPQAERKGLRLVQTVPANLSVLADQEQVVKVLNNLLHNAIKFTPTGGEVRVHTYGMKVKGSDVEELEEHRFEPTWDDAGAPVVAPPLASYVTPMLSPTIDEGNWALFVVEDTGIGISAQDLPRIFERFYKADRARARTDVETSGTGLGLAIAKHIVEAHGGHIWARSTEGKGAIFLFTLPLPD